MPPVQPDTAFGEVTKNPEVVVWDLVHNKFAKPVEQGHGAMQRIDYPGIPSRPASARFQASVVFGAKSDKRTPISDLMANKYAVEGLPGMELAPDRIYAPNEGRRKSNKLPLPKPTRNSVLLKETNRMKFLQQIQVTGHGPGGSSSRPQSARF